MMLGKRNNKSEKPGGDDSYWSIVKKKFVQRKEALWSLRLLIAMVAIALLTEFIANDKPIYCQYEGKTYFPVFREYAVNLGLASWAGPFVREGWSEYNYERAVFPLIPYAHDTQDSQNTRFKSPFGKQQVSSLRYRHWLGTDNLGRDVAAGMIYGTRTALLVGVVAMFVATILGVFFGAIAGYFGDDKLQISRGRLWLMVPGILLGIFYAFLARNYVLAEGVFLTELGKSLLMFLGIIIVFNLLANLLKSII